MKKAVLSLAFALFTIVSFAEIKLGPKAGYNASKLSLEIDTLKSEFRSGFQVGLFVRFGGRFYVQPELYYTTQGGVFESNLNDWEQKIKLGSLDLPVLVGYKVINNDNLNLRIHGGPLASFVVNKTVEEAGGIDGPVKTADIRTINWGIQAGAGVDVYWFTLDVRYQVGLNNLITEVTNTNGTKYTFDSKNNLWVISLGFKI
jgi:hypothetical protein